MITRRTALCLSSLAATLLCINIAFGQAPAPLEQIGVPRTATTLEGQPDVRVETTASTAVRRELSAREAADSRLTISIRDGRLYWGAQERPLIVDSAGEFVYLSSEQPGHYIRLRRVNDRLTYVEHVDLGARTVTYWGELRVLVGR